MEAINNTTLLKKVIDNNSNKSDIPLVKINTLDKNITTMEFPDGDKIAFSNKDLKNLLQKLYIG